MYRRFQFFRDMVHANHIRGKKRRPCWICKIPTKMIEVNFECPLHPGPCSGVAWRIFDKANLKK